MPRQQDIERFKRDLAALSHEAEVLARWGERPEDAILPRAEGAEPSVEVDEGLPPDFAELLDDLPLGSDREAGVPAEEDAELAALLGSLEPSEESVPEEAPFAAGESAFEDSFQLEADREAEAPHEEPRIDGAEPPAEDVSPAVPEPLEELEEEREEAPPAEESPSSLPGLEEFTIPEPAAPGSEEPLAEDFSFEVTDFAEAPASEPTSEEPSSASLEDFSFEPPEPGPEGGADSFELPSEPAKDAGEPAEEPMAPDISETMAVEGLDVAPLEEARFDEALEQGGEMTAFEEPAAPTEETAAPFGGLEDFSIPDLGTVPAEGALSPASPEEEVAGSAPETAPAESSPDSFESFSFDDMGAGAGFELPSIGSESADLDEEIASLGEEVLAADTFKLDQEWGGFETSAPATGAPRPAPPRPRPEAPQAPPEDFKPISLSESQVDALQDSLLSYPLNLRVAIEDLLANGKGTEAQRSRLVWAMVEGASPEDAAGLAGKALKRRIEIPSGYQKRTGAALEARKGTLAYAFVRTFLPALWIGFLVMAAAGIVGYLGWRLVYIPLSANALYRTGYERIAQDRYPEAEDAFAKATRTKEYVAWYYRYAEAYEAKRQYILAERKYASLVERYPRETEGILAWARLEREQMKYEEAVKVLKGVSRRAGDESARGMTGLLSWDYYNEDGLLLLGDVYLDWAEEDPSKFADARKSYATLIERYGETDLYLERMLLYFMRTDRLDEVLPLKRSLASDLKRTSLDAETLAELGGYLLDKDTLDDLRPLLLRAAEKDPSAPEPYYQLARYYRRAAAVDEERKALDKAIRAFSSREARSARLDAMYVDSLVWRGDYLFAAGERLTAELDYAAAAAEYERSVELRRLRRGPRFGKAYAGLAEVAFWERDDLDVALGYYERAARDGYSTPVTRYRIGNILYRKKRYAESLEPLYESLRGGGDSPYALFAFGCALYARNDFFAAEAQFRKIADDMEAILSRIDQPMPQERSSEVETLRLCLQAQNNLGAAIYRTAARSGDARRRADAMAAWARSIKLYDILSQKPEALENPATRNLGLVNMNSILETGRGESIVVYSEIEKDPTYPKK